MIREDPIAESALIEFYVFQLLSITKFILYGGVPAVHKQFHFTRARRFIELICIP